MTCSPKPSLTTGIRYSEKKRRDEWHFVDMTTERGHSYRFDLDGISEQRIAGVAPTWHVRPSIFMPREASRILLDNTGMRVERLQDISERDAQDEGINLEGEGVFYAGAHGTASDTAKDSYRLLWEQINGAGSWDANPWVWAVEFTRIEAQKQHSKSGKPGKLR